MSRSALGALVVLAGLCAAAPARADSFPDCADKMYRYLPGADLATRRRAEAVCSYGLPADKLVACADKVGRLLPGGGAAARDQAIDLCVDMTAHAVTPEALTLCSDRVYDYLPGAGSAARLRALRACRHGITAEALLACAENAPRSGGAGAKERALTACVEELRPADPRQARRGPSNWPALTSL